MLVNFKSLEDGSEYLLSNVRSLLVLENKYVVFFFPSVSFPCGHKEPYSFRSFSLLAVRHEDL